MQAEVVSLESSDGCSIGQAVLPDNHDLIALLQAGDDFHFVGEMNAQFCVNCADFVAFNDIDDVFFKIADGQRGVNGDDIVPGFDEHFDGDVHAWLETVIASLIRRIIEDNFDLGGAGGKVDGRINLADAALQARKLCADGHGSCRD